MRISCVIITRNEEKNIGRCLQSLNGVADEIIVIDSYSEDRTEEICRKYTGEFHQMAWQGYSKTKNYGNSLARYDYILSLDADEMLSDELREELVRLKQQDVHADAYKFRRLTNYCGTWIKHCGWFPDWKTRLWKKDKARWKGSIHETLELDPECSVRRLDALLCHYSYYSVEEHWKRVEKYAGLQAEEYARQGRHVSRMRLLTSPVAKFFTMYFLRLGFMDGRAGFKICRISAWGAYQKYYKARKLRGTAKD